MVKKRIVKKCKVCGKMFEVIPSLERVEHCSYACGRVTSSKKMLGNTKGFQKGHTSCLGRELSEITKKKISDSMNEQYATGVRDRFDITKKANEIRRKGATSQNFRKRVFDSDIPKVCAMCNNTNKLEAHHIIPQEYNGRCATGKGDHSLSNAMILCKKCHDIKKKGV